MNVNSCYRISIYDNDRVVEKLTLGIQLFHNRNENDQKSL